MGRRPLGRDRHLSVRVSPLAVAWLDAEAARLGASRNDVLCQLIEAAMMAEPVVVPLAPDELEAEQRG